MLSIPNDIESAVWICDHDLITHLSLIIISNVECPYVTIMIDNVSTMMIITTKVMIDFVQEHSLTTILDGGSMELPVGGEVLIMITILLSSISL